MTRIAKPNMTCDEFCSNIDYLAEGASKRENPVLVATAQALAHLETVEPTQVAFAAFQFGYVFAQVDAAAEWRKSHRKKDRRAFEDRRRRAIEMVRGMKEARPRRTYEDIEAEVAEGLGLSPRTIRRWRRDRGT